MRFSLKLLFSLQFAAACVLGMCLLVNRVSNDNSITLSRHFKNNPQGMAVNVRQELCRTYHAGKGYPTPEIKGRLVIWEP